jgi:prepilin-type N-terminal cleavage/methylation domain-containing protein
MRKFQPRGRTAFTLIEVVIVVVIMAILATLAVVSLGGIIDRYQLSRAIEAIEMFDARARRDARCGRQPVQATIQPSKRRLMIAPSGNESDRQATLFHLPGSVDIKEFRLRRQVAAGRDLEIQFNREGWSPTYAVQLQRGNMSRWLVVLGISGQVIELDNGGEVDEILSL